MKKLLSIRYTTTAFNISMLLVRLSAGLMLISYHGIPKMIKFQQLSPTFYDPFGIGHKASLVLILFAEVFCSLLVVLGLFTRLAVIPIIIAMLVAIFGVHKGVGPEAELAMIYGTAAFVLLLCGPGRISVDGMIGK